MYNISQPPLFLTPALYVSFTEGRVGAPPSIHSARSTGPGGRAHLGDDLLQPQGAGNPARSPLPVPAPRAPLPQVVDKFNDLLVTAYVTSGQARFMMLHEARASEEALRQFFQEVHEAYVKARPLHARGKRGGRASMAWAQQRRPPRSGRW